MSPRWIAGFAAWASVLTLGVANASVLGGLTASTLAAWNQSGTPPTPTIFTCDNFALAAPTGSALVGRPVQLPAKCGGGIWSVHRGTWIISAGQLDPSGGNATATILAGQADISAEATVLNANSSNRVAGVAINHSGATRRYLAAVLLGPGTAQLRLVNGNSVTTLASATVIIGASAVVRVTRIGVTVTVSVDGTLAFTHTLTPSQGSTLAGGSQVGLYWGAGNPIRFTNIVATAAVSP